MSALMRVVMCTSVMILLDAIRLYRIAITKTRHLRCWICCSSLARTLRQAPVSDDVETTQIATQQLTEAVEAEKPKKWLQISAKGLLDAAKALTGVPKVFQLAQQISQMIEEED